LAKLQGRCRKQRLKLARLDALPAPRDSLGEVEALNGFFRRYALAA
jgi:hypothetical protein